ncbi:MAG: hypothetical protein AMXMBFR46_05660 [Acidimicrobiia bacterium]
MDLRRGPDPTGLRTATARGSPRRERAPGPTLDGQPAAARHRATPPDRRAPGAQVSKKTKKRKLNARRKKANHGRRPNAGRR